MNWEQYTRTRAYYLLPLAVWGGFGFLILCTDKSTFGLILVGFDFIGGGLISMYYYMKQKNAMRYEL